MKFVAAIVSTLMVFSPCLGGDLTPPVGPVASTMKTLQEVEPRTPVQSLPGNATAMFAITQPGSYYLTGNIEAAFAGVNAIEVFADGVTLDLMGFTIDGVGRTGLNGIVVDSSEDREGIAIVNGSVRGFIEHGIAVDSGAGARFDRLSLVDCGFEGLRAGNGATVTNCTATGISNTGIWLFNGGTVENCAARFCGANGFNIGHGGAAMNCTADSSGRGFNWDFDNSLTGCIAFLCGDGFYGGSGTTLTGCSAQKNGRGFATSERNLLVNCNASLNAVGYDIGFDCTARGCIANQNFDTGFRMYGERSTLEDAQAANNATGLDLTGAKMLVIRCRLHDNSISNLTDAGGNYVAPILTPPDLATNTNPNANFGF